MSKVQFQTFVDLPKYSFKTDHRKHNLFLGSCFTENVGQYMKGLKYSVDINPFGILYNPFSVADALSLLMNERAFMETDLREHKGLWHSFKHHGRFSSEDKIACLADINNGISNSAAYLRKANFLFITFGTAWVYRLKQSGEVVANCHKIPANEFTRERLSVSEIVEKYSLLLAELWTLNPKLKVVFTVSPVRHWKDGAIENQRSKSTLLLAIDELQKRFGDESCAYFPSYEIVMDELRDYRFYNEDMLHPSKVAIQLIWDNFEQALIAEESVRVSREVQKVVNAVNHRPINKGSVEHQKFLNSFLKKIKELERKYPFVNLSLEKDYFNVQLNASNNSD